MNDNGDADNNNDDDHVTSSSGCYNGLWASLLNFIK